MKPHQSPAWDNLTRHVPEMRTLHMRDMFADDPDRFSRYSFEACSIFLDYSKNRIVPETLEHLFALARDMDVEGWRTKMFEGQQINETEHRAALHTALRAPKDGTVLVDGENVIPHVNRVKARMRDLCDGIREGRILGATGKRITDVVNIGIGGSHLGPQLAVEALAPYTSPDMNMHFVSGMDGIAFDTLTRNLSWDTSLFIIGSKSFSTQETIMNANGAREWFLQAGGGEADIRHHFVSVSSRPDLARDFGIPAENVFEMWDWVGGRYSMWSAVGLAIAFAIGMDNFEDLLEGAYRMDRHFLDAPLEKNMPVIMALLGVLYTNFFDVRSHAVVPYTQLLRALPDYLQQLDMESNGKRTTIDGEPVQYATAPVIWGGVGTSVQHSFFQRLHQGRGFVPVDFIAATEPSVTENHRNAALLANCFAQSQALMQGKRRVEAHADMVQAGLPVAEVEALAQHKTFPGNRPSNTLLLKRLDPRTLGALIALYEHKVFVQGVIWNIDSFDQWGVELGKTLAQSIGKAFEGGQSDQAFDSSTQGLIDAARKSD